MPKPFSEACEENKDAILAVLREVFADRTRVLEVGSGTGQHAAYLPRFLPHLRWQPSDLAGNLPGVRLWLAEAGLPNVAEPRVLDVHQADWGPETYDGVFSANTAHILDWFGVSALFQGVGRVLEPGGVFALYGPFSYGGEHTSESNARFDAFLKSRDPGSGVRDLDDLRPVAASAGLALERDFAMPANNRTLVWRRSDLRW